MATPHSSVSSSSSSSASDACASSRMPSEEEEEMLVITEAESLTAIFGPDAFALIPLEELEDSHTPLPYTTTCSSSSSSSSSSCCCCCSSSSSSSGGSSRSRSSNSKGFYAIYRDDVLNFELKLLIRPSYPQLMHMRKDAVEVVHLVSHKSLSHTSLKAAMLAKIRSFLHERQDGVCVLFDVIDLCRSEIQSSLEPLLIAEKINEPLATIDSVHNLNSFAPSLNETIHPLSTSHNSSMTRNPIYQGETLIEKKSVFLASFSKVESMEDVHLFQNILLSDKKIARATHNIMAYRFTGPTGILHHDCDDDGEAAAGGRLAEMIRLMDANNVIVVVSRWFGGTLLGPDRFKFICNSARFLLESHGYGAGTGKVKKEEEKQKEKLETAFGFTSLDRYLMYLEGALSEA